MDKIKLIDTGKTKILAVMVQEGATNVRFRFNRFLTYRRPHSNHIEMFNEPCEMIGLSTELTEEQCVELVPYPKDNDYFFVSMQDQLRQILEANQCYSVNPLGGKPYILGCDSMNEFDVEMDKWQQAQEKTGNWLILMEK